MRPGRVLRALFAAGAIGLAPSSVLAQALSYGVELDAPDAQRELLQKHLEIYSARDNPRMSADQLRFLVRRTPAQIRELLATEGYYSPEIKASLEQRAGAWLARLIVVPGEAARVASIELGLEGALLGEARAMHLATIRKRWPLRAGMVFRQAQWEDAKRNALQVLLGEDYPAAKITSSTATVDPQTQQVALMVVIDSGPAFSFGVLEISGLERYPRSVIERLNTIKPGSPYSQAQLLQLQSRLQDSRYFTTALVSTDVDPARAQQVPIKVEVTEAQSRKLGFGLGASTNTGARGQVEYQDLNLLDRAWRLSSLLKLESKTQQLSGSIAFPRTAADYVDSVSALAERTDIQQDVTRKFTLGAKRSRVRGDIERAYSVQYETETETVAGVPKDSNQALVGGYAWTLRRVDNLLYPRDGYLVNAQIGVAAKALLSDQDFVRNYVKARYYRSLSRQDGLIVRAELGATLARSRQGIPSDFLFRAGGDQSVRGYAYQSLGVKSGDAVVGGRYLGVASVEYLRWLNQNWGAAVFYDVGTAADSPHDFTPVHGYGAGARWRSPVGQLNLDLAYGREAGRLRVHFSVGIPF